jgi:phosphatidylserine decarboxylase
LSVAYHDLAGITSLAAGTVRGEVMTATAPFRVGGWLLSDQAILGQWVGDLVAKVEAEGEQSLLPVVDEFRRLIENVPSGPARRGSVGSSATAERRLEAS